MLRNGDSKRNRRAMLAALLLSCLAAAVPAGASDAESEHALATKARGFAENFLAGEHDRNRGDLDATMLAGFPASTAEQIRGAMLGLNGAVKSIGEPWLEAAQQGYRRFRVPVEFEKARLDLRVVYDSDGRVAGFFQAAHVPSPTAGGEPIEGGSAGGEPPEVAGHWEGSIQVPGSALNVIVDLTYAGGNWSGSCDIPQQGAKGLILGGFKMEGDAVEFVLAGVPGDPSFKGRLESGEIVGLFTQGGNSFPFSLSRDELPKAMRPQEPRRPWPYSSENVTFPNGVIVLAGTLTAPRGAGPFAAALLVSGSGPQNRDEEVFEHKPFLVLADALTRAGIAVLRVDDRGVGESTGSMAAATTADLAGDALAGVKFLLGRSEIDGKRIGLIGHSEGGIIAPLVASESDDIAFVVMLAGPGVPGDEILPLQLERISLAAGMDPERIGAVRAKQEKLLARIKADAEPAVIREQYRELIVAQYEAFPGVEPPAGEELEAMVDQSAEMTTPWFRYFLSHDPRAALREVTVPVLALFGELDLQVPPEQSAPEVSKAVRAAGNADATVTTLPGLNHLFQKATTGGPDEYYSIEETMNPAALEAVTEWIVKRFGSAAVETNGK